MIRPFGYGLSGTLRAVGRSLCLLLWSCVLVSLQGDGDGAHMSGTGRPSAVLPCVHAKKYLLQRSVRAGPGAARGSGSRALKVTSTSEVLKGLADQAKDIAEDGTVDWSSLTCAGMKFTTLGIQLTRELIKEESALVSTDKVELETLAYDAQVAFQNFLSQTYATWSPLRNYCDEQLEKVEGMDKTFDAKENKTVACGEVNKELLAEIVKKLNTKLKALGKNIGRWNSAADDTQLKFSELGRKLIAVTSGQIERRDRVEKVQKTAQTVRVVAALLVLTAGAVVVTSAVIAVPATGGAATAHFMAIVTYMLTHESTWRTAVNQLEAVTEIVMSHLDSAKLAGAEINLTNLIRVIEEQSHRGITAIMDIQNQGNEAYNTVMAEIADMEAANPSSVESAMRETRKTITRLLEQVEKEKGNVRKNQKELDDWKCEQVTGGGSGSKSAKGGSLLSTSCPTQ